MRLVVGKINLVEKIAQLAQLPANKGNSVMLSGSVAAKDKMLDMDGEWGVVNGPMGGNGLGFGGRR